MKRSGLFGQPAWLCAIAFAALGLACPVRTGDRHSAPAPASSTPPLVYPANPQGGYAVNPVLGDSIVPLENADGTRPLTGRIMPIEGTAANISDMSLPGSVPAKPPRIVTAYSIEKPFPAGPVAIAASFQPDHSPRGYPEDDATPSAGKDLTSGSTVPAAQSFQAIVTPYRPFSPVRAHLPQRRYDATCNIQVLGSDQGLTLDNVSSLLVDRQQRLWVGMRLGGATCYDGTFFTNFIPPNGLPSTSVEAILEDRRGRLWLASTGGVTCFDGDSFSSYQPGNGLSRNWITALEEDQHGRIWLGTHGAGISQLAPDARGHSATIAHFGPASGISSVVHALLADRHGQLWIGTEGEGLIRCRPDASGAIRQVSRMAAPEGFPADHVFALHEDVHGDLWIGSNKGLFRLCGAKGGTSPRLIRVTLSRDGQEPAIRALAGDPHGGIWAGTSGQGVYHISPDRLGTVRSDTYTHFTEREGLSNAIVTAIATDSSGNVWLGTEGGGVCVIRPRMFMHYGVSEGFTRYAVNAIREDSRGFIWFGTQGGGVIRYRPPHEGLPGTFAHFTDAQGLPDNNISCIEEDTDGQMWFGTSPSEMISLAGSGASGTLGKGLTRFNGHAFLTLSEANHLTSNNIHGMTLDRHGNLWVATASGLNLLPTQTLRDPASSPLFRFTMKEGLARQILSTVIVDSKGGVWFGTFGAGVGKYLPGPSIHAGTLIHLTPREGLPFRNLLSVSEDAKGQLWLGTGLGLVRYRQERPDGKGEFTFFGERRMIQGNNIRSQLIDAAGRIWAGTHRGLRVVGPFPETSEPPPDIHLARPDGLKGEEFIINSAHLDRNGRAWWGTRVGGVETLDLWTAKWPKSAPVPHVKWIEINGRFLDFRQLPDNLKGKVRIAGISPFQLIPAGLTLPFDQRHITFHFSATSLDSPHRLSYSFRMAGLGEVWSPPSPEPKAEYRSLPAGTYTFHLRARGHDGGWSGPATYAFTIRPPWWFAPWAYAAYFLLGLAGLYSLYRFQLTRKLALADRERLIEHDRLKNRLYTNITHEFRTPLTLIHGPLTQALERRVAPDEAIIRGMYRQSLRLQQLIAQMLDLQKLDAGHLHPTYTQGDIVAFARYVLDAFVASAAEKGITLAFEATPDALIMDLDEEKTTQILSNLLSNAIRHTPASGHVGMRMLEDPDVPELLIEIADSGAGILPGDLPHIFERFYQSAQAASGGTGIGLELTKSLVDLLGGRIMVDSHPGKGSVFRVWLPIQHNAALVPANTSGVAIRAIPAAEDEVRFPPPPDPDPGKPIILVVEDNRDVAGFVASCLQEEFAVLLAADGGEGVALAIDRIPDLVVSDIMMPVMDGFALCRELKADFRTCHVPVILLTGRGDHPAVMEGLDVGADAYVVKPFAPAELVLRVKKLLESRAQLRQYYQQVQARTLPSDQGHVLSRDVDFINGIREFIEDHLTDDQFNMQMLCRHIGMSHPQLHRKIVSLTGASAGKLVRSVRLAKAAGLLREPGLTVAEIAYRTGFSDPGYFTKVFVRDTGITPSEYRAQGMPKSNSGTSSRDHP